MVVACSDQNASARPSPPATAPSVGPANTCGAETFCGGVHGGAAEARAGATQPGGGEGDGRRRSTARQAAGIARPGGRTAGRRRRMPPERGARGGVALRSGQTIGFVLDWLVAPRGGRRPALAAPRRLAASPSQAGRSPSTWVTAVGSRGRRSGLAPRAAALRGLLPLEVLGRVRRLGPVGGAHARARRRQETGREKRGEHAPLDPDGGARVRDGGLVEQPPDQQQLAPSRRPAMITRPSPPGRWKPCAARAPRPERARRGDQQDGRLDEREHLQRRQVRAHRHGRRPLRTKNDFSYHGSSSVKASASGGAACDPHRRGAAARSGARPASSRRRARVAPPSMPRPPRPECTPVTRSGCPRPRAAARARRLEPLEVAVDQRADREEQLAQGVEDLPRQLGRDRLAGEVEQRAALQVGDAGPGRGGASPPRGGTPAGRRHARAPRRLPVGLAHEPVGLGVRLVEGLAQAARARAHSPANRTTSAPSSNDADAGRSGASAAAA